MVESAPVQAASLPPRSRPAHRNATAVAARPAPARAHRSLRRLLLEEPSRFTFDAAVAVAMRASGQADPGAALRFQAPSGLAFAAADVLAMAQDGVRFKMTTGLLGLTGPGGVLPRPYTELVNGEQRGRSPALAAFLDVLAQRPLAQFAASAIKYRPHRAADAAAIAANTPDAQARRRSPPQDGMRGALAALAGFATPGLA